MSTQAIIFDRDNTLLHFDRAAIANLELRIAELAPGLPAGAAATHWASWPGSWPQQPAEEPAFWRSFWQSLAEHYHQPAHTAAALESLGDFYHAIFAAYPDAAPCLAALRERGMRLAVLTNFELPSVDRTLAHAGLDPAWFDVLLSSGAIGVAKPDPRAFQLAATALDLPVAACLFLDDLVGHVEAARAIGMPALLLDRRSALPDFDGRLTSLAELPNFLDRLQTGTNTQ
jgi:putative hydrolase of the HAD superfamily